jgi:hypothetical protein
VKVVLANLGSEVCSSLYLPSIGEVLLLAGGIMSDDSDSV